MNNKLLVDAGENFEYVKTIVENKIELAKIELAEKLGTMLSKVVLFAVLGLLGLLFIISLFIILSIWLTELLGSAILAIAVVSSVIFVIGAILLVFQKKVVSRPVTNFIVNNILDLD